MSNGPQFLSLLISGAVAGTLMQHDGAIAFVYDEAYQGPDISVRMPRSEGGAPYPDAVVRPWLEGLLPDDPSARAMMGAPWDIKAYDTFGLLSHNGLDCPGAVQICAPGDTEHVRHEEGPLEPISEAQIRRRLEAALDAAAPKWTMGDESWSLGGNQAKLALHWSDGRWYRCLGSAPSTVIVKPGIGDLAFRALNEYLCMRLARACGLPAAHARHVEFDGLPAIVVERYDRLSLPNGGIARVHQEDLCQALGCSPVRKYAFDGGPNTREVMELLQRATPQGARVFSAALFFNYLVGATDGHAKNYSLLHLRGSEVRLAPLYDIASALPYSRRHGRGPWRAAMNIGGENRIGWMRKGPLQRFDQASGFEPGFGRALMLELASRLLDCMGPVFDGEAPIVGMTELRERLEPKLHALCVATIENIDRSGSELRIDPLVGDVS